MSHLTQKWSGYRYASDIRRRIDIVSMSFISHWPLADFRSTLLTAPAPRPGVSWWGTRCGRRWPRDGRPTRWAGPRPRPCRAGACDRDHQQSNARSWTRTWLARARIESLWHVEQSRAEPVIQPRGKQLFFGCGNFGCTNFTKLMRTDAIFFYELTRINTELLWICDRNWYRLSKLTH